MNDKIEYLYEQIEILETMLNSSDDEKYCFALRLEILNLFDEIEKELKNGQ